MSELLNSGRTTPYEKQYIRKDGTRRWALSAATHVSDDEGVEFVIDITEQKLLQQQKDEFISIASHELKTPVTSIRLYADALKEQFENADDKKSAGLMEKLTAQVARLGKLIRDLLDTTRIAEGTLSLAPEPFDLNALITEVVEEMRHISPRRRVLFRPSPLQPVTADREKIGQVLTNLLSNAVRYSPDGGEVTVSAGETAAGVKVSVSDQGIGIPEPLIKNLFTRFYRVVNEKIQNFQGMGLGLYISAGIIRRHGGEISVQSREGRGSVFSFTLPRNGNGKTKAA